MTGNGRSGFANLGMRGAAMAYMNMLRELDELVTQPDEDIQTYGVHRDVHGRWEDCYLGEECYSPYHIPDMTVAQVAAMPGVVVLDLLNAVTPADDEWVEPGELVWLDQTGRLPHREYDLPAIVMPGRWYEWQQQGELHRENGLPARVQQDGTMEWWLHNELHPPHSKMPARIEPQPDGTWRCDWFYRGTPLESEVLPASRVEELIPAELRNLDTILHGGYEGTPWARI